MAYTKISDLPLGTLPLTGDELAEIVQDGVNVQVPSSALGGGGSGGGAGWYVADTGTGAAQNIILPISGLTPEEVLVFGNGIKYHASEYDIAGITLTLTTNAAGDEIEIVPAGASGVGSTNDTNLQFYGSFAKWNAAKARGPSAPALALFVGDSNVVGEGYLGAGTQPNMLKEGFARSFAEQMGWLTGSIVGCQVGGVTADFLSANPTVTMNGGWEVTTNDAEVLGRKFFRRVGAVGTGTFTWTPEEEFSTLRFVWPRAAGLNTAVAVKIDGATVATLNQAGADAVLSADYTVTQGIHTVEIVASGTGDAYAEALIILDDVGTPVHLQAGWSGAKAADLIKSTSPWAAKPEIQLIDPDYVLYYCTINDADATTALNAWYDKVEEFVATAAPTANGCLLMGYPLNDVNTVNGYYDNMATGLRNIARDYGWSFFDLRQVWGRSYAKVSALGFNRDALHPDNAGHDAAADALFSFLGGSL